MTTGIRILFSKVAGKQKMKTDGSNSIFNVVGKRKRNLKVRFLMTWVNEKRNWKLEFHFPISQEKVGTKVHALSVQSKQMICVLLIIRK